MNLCDYHTHTPLCLHAEGEPEEYIQAAITAGVQEYGISDHAPVKPEPFDDWRMLYEHLPKYYAWIERARVEAGGRLWDYLIGSVHYLADKWDFDNPVWLGRWAETDVEEVWGQYWKTYEAMVRSGLFEIYAHADLIKKFGYRPEGNLRRFYDPVVNALSEQKATIEINTAGWHKPCEEQYPAEGFLSLCAEAGVSLIISSDAHAPSEVARDFGKAIGIAKTAGFTHTVSIKQGAKTELELP